MSDTNRITIGRATLRLPDDHTLREIYLAHPSYDFVHWNIISSLVAENGLSNIGLIDVGANVGDSIAHFRRRHLGRIIAIEPDEVFRGFCQENCNQFNDVSVLQSLVCPQEYQGAVSFEKIVQTGRTVLGDGEVYRGSYISVSQLLKRIPGPLVFKTDTDGFDAEILCELVNCIEQGDGRVKVISFEGPTEEQMNSGSFGQFLDPIKRLQAFGYRVLILSNLGFPVAFPGRDFGQVDWHLNRLHIESKYGRASCHYFDFVAIAPDLKCTTCNFDCCDIFDDVYAE
ncbi:FkbM family methyltransferase [Maritalea porphyrae]|nr:FkbM family methyltransferase [Maritalea porphyrae]